VTAHENLDLWSDGSHLPEVADQAILQLRVQVRLGLFNDDSHVEQVREEGILFGLRFRIRLC
jgi:hypothetical protein